MRTGWCIEKGELGTPLYAYLHSMYGSITIGWTFNHMDALRLAWREDAEKICGMVGGARVVEHLWSD